MSDQAIRDGVHVPSLVLFDLDDTLCDHYSSLRLRLRDAFSAAAGEALAIDIESLVEESAERSVGGTGHFAELLAKYGIDDRERHDLAVSRYVSDRFRGLQLYQESIEIVLLVRQFAQVGLITNGPSQIQRDKIEHLEIADLFQFILVSEEEGVWKPDPVIFERALAITGARAVDAVYVGDSPEHDIAGARAAGIRSIWINRRERIWPGGPRPDHEITSLLELPELLGLTERPTSRS